MNGVSVTNIFERIIEVEELNKGWSDDKKYIGKDECGNKYLIRKSSLELKEIKRAEYAYLKKVSELDINVSKPIEYKEDDEYVYMLISWIDGDDASDVIKTLNPEKQYKLGIVAGKYLKDIHTIKAEVTSIWEEKFNYKIDKKIRRYRDADIEVEGADMLIKYVETHRYLLKGRKQSFHHGDYHIANMIINDNKELGIIDFNRFDFGDPWEEFNRIVWSAQISEEFATGTINGYFNNKVPSDFFELMALYIGVSQIGGLVWGYEYSESQYKVILKLFKDVLSWYDNFERVVPSWYKGIINY
ncbi:MAG: phosphotransferase [Clostridia bacterium]|jgi:serine/threonine-protein kinase|nr:phosphotransferase [Clostridia bacterium]